MSKAFRFDRHGGPEVLRFEDVEPGTPGPGEVRMRNTAVAVNYRDVLMRRGVHAVRSFPSGIGLESAGVIDAVGYRGEVERLYPDPLSFQTRWAAVDEVLAAAVRHEREARKPTLASFLQELTLSASDDGEGEDGKPREAITLMTLHSAKGLEFERVYLVGLEEGLFPHARSVAEDGIEEERRLMYVGITRARRNLTLTCTAARAKYGRNVESMPSRFLFEMNGETPPKDWRPAGSPPVLVRRAQEPPPVSEKKTLVPRLRLRDAARPPSRPARSRRGSRPTRRRRGSPEPPRGTRDPRAW